MFCSVCGQPIPDRSTFCSVCGTPVAPAGYANPQAQLQAQYQFQKNALRQGEIQALNSVIHFFSRLKSTFDEYKVVSEKAAHYACGAKAALIVWGTIIFTIGMLVLGLSGGSDVATSSIMAFLLPGSAMIVGGIFMQVNNRKKYAQYSKRQQELAAILNGYYQQYPDCPVGIDYCDPKTLNNIMSILQSGRADTIKEAISLL